MNFPSDRKRENSAVRTRALRICCPIAATGVVLVGVFLFGAWWQRRSIEAIDHVTEEAAQHSEQVDADVTALRGDIAELQGKSARRADELGRLGEKLMQFDDATEKAAQHSEQVKADVTALRGDIAELQGKLARRADELGRLGEKLTQLERDQRPHNAVEDAAPEDENRETIRLLKLIPVEVERGMIFEALQMRELHSPLEIHLDDTRFEIKPFDVKDFGPGGLPELRDFENARPKP